MTSSHPQDDFDRWDAWPSQEDQFLGSNAGYQNKIDTFYNTVRASHALSFLLCQLEK